MKVSPILGVAVWGLGKHSINRVLPAINSSETVKLVGVTSRDATVGSAIAENFGCLYWKNPSDMLKDPGVEVVYLSTPIGLHGKMGRSVLEADRHLWCEKSLTNSLEESFQLISLARKKDLALCEAFMYQYHPQFDRLKDIVFSSNLGEIVSITSRFTIPQLDQPGFRNSLELGGGAFLDIGCYPISLALELLGKDFSVDFAELEGEPGSEVDRKGRAVLKSVQGATAYLEWGMGWAYRNEVTICGKNKSIYADKIFSKSPDQPVSIQIRDRYGTPSEEIISPADHFTLMIEMFVRGVRESQARKTFWDDAESQASLMDLISKAIP